MINQISDRLRAAWGLVDRGPGEPGSIETTLPQGADQNRSGI